MAHARSRDQSVAPWNLHALQLCSGGKLTPYACNFLINGQNSIAELLFQSLYPRHDVLLAPAFWQERGTLCQLTDGDDAEENGICIQLGYPMSDSRVAIVASQFGNNADVQKRFHQVTSRIGLLSRSRSMSSKAGPVRR